MGHVRRRPDQPHPEPADRPMGGRRHHMDPLHRQRIPGRTPAAQHAADRTRRQAERRAVIVTGSYVQREYTNQQGAKRSILELRATDLAVSLRAGTVAYNKAPRDNGFAGRTPQPSQPMAQPQPQQPTTPPATRGTPREPQTRQPAFTDGFAPAAPQQPAI